MKKTANEFKDKSIVELEKETVVLRQEMVKLQLEGKVNPQKDTNILFKKRKRLAVLLTIKTEKKRLEQLQNLKK